MEPDKQVEIQLGHMCNNRCAFCVSGQRTAMGEALPLATEPILESIREARDRGHRKITLLGGEPTLQPGFMDVVRECVALEYSEIVIFTNGVKTARAQVIDDVLATGGNFTWRISIQGATEEHHEATTRKVGSFARIVRTLENLSARGQRITVNMCVVGSNFESVPHFPALLGRYGVSQLHLDLVRPMDAGVRTEEELRALMPPLSDLAPSFTEMIAGFDEAFDVNIGNLPYCVAPHLARFIHHDGQATETIAVDDKDDLSRPWDKYFTKRRDKIKPAACTECLFEDRCSGVFETYEQFHGVNELVPITIERLREADPDMHFLALHIRAVTDSLADTWKVEERGDSEVFLTCLDDETLRVALRRGDAPDAFARYGEVSLHRLGRVVEAPSHLALLRGLAEVFEAAGMAPVHPIGDDAVASLRASIAVRLRRIRDGAPFGELSIEDVRVADRGARAEVSLRGPSGEGATVWLGERYGRPTGGYTLAEGSPRTEALARGVSELLAVFRRPALDRADPPA